MKNIRRMPASGLFGDGIVKTKTIRYNLKERGRTFRGKPRNFDIPRLVSLINGGPVQEKVKHRDMYGYYGHWPRLKFGMNPAEGGIVDGKQVAVEPALVTTSLRAFPDGTVEHEAEFLDNGPGKLAWRLFNSKTGGFSSAIDERAPDFYGFDYVLEPNFTTNRGYDIALDALGGEEGLTLDDVAVREYNQQVAGMIALLDAVNKDNERTLAAMARLQEENEQLMSMLTRAGRAVSLDGLESVLPVAVSVDTVSRMRRDTAEFLGGGLVVPGKVEEKALDTAAPANKLLAKMPWNN